MSKNKFEVVDYEDAVRLYGDIVWAAIVTGKQAVL